MPSTAPSPSPGGVSLTIRDGLVTLKADQASIRQILAEWERQGQMKVVGAEKITAAPVTLTFKDVPEKMALDIVMRGIPGYMAIDRTTAAAGVSASRFDRLVVMARATTPVPAMAAAGSRPAPAAAQPVMPQQPPAFSPPVYAGMPPQAGDDDQPQQPDRSDADQFANQEPPMPEAPVVSPYPNAYPGSPYVGAAGASGPYGGNPTAAAAAGLSAAPPETQFDYANPQKYFEQRRLEQQAASPQPSPFPSAGTGVQMGTTGQPAPLTGSPTAPTTLARPGIAPVPQPTTGTPAQGQFFNPYNLPADWVPPPPVPDSGTPVEPDRAKYNNPYEQPKPPQ
jgi:hypothetical protein